MFLATLFAKVGLYVVHMPAATDRSKSMVGMRDDYSEWAEFKALRKASLKAVAKFIYEVWMACFGCLLLIVKDGGLENQTLTKELLVRFNVRNVQVATYHLQSNGLVERGNQNIVDTLAKLMAPLGRPENWPAHLAVVSCGHRITVCVGLFTLPCSFRSLFEDCTCTLYGRPVRAALQLLLVN